ncbi:MAG: hypothetical protein ACQKBY_06710 [Verrucomicrobiales bacterium]
MKKLLAIAVALIAGGFALPNQAEAGTIRIGYSTVYVSGHASCGTPIYTRRVCVGHDRYHRPIYRYTRLPLSHHRGHMNHHRGHHRGHYDRHRGHHRGHWDRHRGHDRGHWDRHRGHHRGHGHSSVRFRF